LVLQGEYEASLKDCNKAVKLNKKYIKAYLRRANANEALEKLEDALQGERVA
jgi:tetratricopeptide (TPR) repeat protein